MTRIDNIRLYHGDCLEIMPALADGGVDCIIADLPYGTTACKWDVIIPFDKLWEQLNRICKDNSPIILFGAEPFSSKLRLSNPREFRYDLVWEKTIFPNFMFVKKQPARLHELISVFYRKQPTYNPQMQQGRPYKDGRILRQKSSGHDIASMMGQLKKRPIDNKGQRYPSTILQFSNANNGHVHPTQKPTALLEYLIRTYTNEGDTVLDCTMGSGSTMVACANTGRRGIGIELMQEYYDIAVRRVREAVAQPKLDLLGVINSDPSNP